MYRRLEFYFETSPLKTRLYFSVWCTNLSRVRQEMSISDSLTFLLHLKTLLKFYFIHGPLEHILQFIKTVASLNKKYNKCKLEI